MSSISKATEGGKTEPPSLEPYAELMLRALCSTLRELPSVWLILDPQGRRYLTEEGIGEYDLRIAINDGVRANLIMRNVLGWMPAIALRERVVRDEKC